MKITAEQLRRICPQTPHKRLTLFVDPLNVTFEEFEISNATRVRAFIAQYAHETNGFQHLEENLRYTTAEALTAATKPRWDALDADDAWGYLNQPERLANRIYANRMGNGDEASGDGWKYRGRGLCHLTFRGNYLHAGEWLGLDLIENPDQAADIPAACRVGGWFWKSERCSDFADRGDFHDLTKRINGALNGIEGRIAYLNRANEAIA